MRRIILVLMACMLLLPAWPVAAADTPIQAEMNYIIIRPYKGGVDVVNMVSFRNTSKETYAGVDGKVIQISLPQGAKNVALFNEKDTSVVVGKEEITSKQTLKPDQIVDLPYAYKLDGGETGTIPLMFDYPSKEVHILIPDGRGDINLADTKSVKSTYSFNAQNYIGYTVQNIKAGQELSVSYKAAPNLGGELAPEGQDGQKETTPAEKPAWLQFYEQSPFRTIPVRIFIAVVAALAVIGLLYGFSRWQKRRSSGADGSSDSETYQALVAKQTVLMDKLVELEQAHKEQKISDEEFAKQKDVCKDLLVKVKLQLQEQSNTR